MYLDFGAIPWGIYRTIQFGVQFLVVYGAYFMGEYMIEGRSREIKSLVVKSFFGTIILSLLIASQLGTHTENCNDPVYGGCDTVQDFFPTRRETNEYFVFIFTILYIPFFVGLIKKYRSQKKEPQHESTLAINDSTAMGKKKILHFEADQFLADMDRAILESSGFIYVRYPNADPDPVPIVRKERPDLIITRILTHGQLDGFEIAKQLKANEATKDLPIFGSDNLPYPDTVNKARETGMVDYRIMGETLPSELVEEVKNILFVQSLKSPKLLIFEDDSMLGEMYKAKFEQMGFTVALYDNPTSSPVGVVIQEKPDVILMNIIMPVMDGLEATRLIKRNEGTKHIPLVIESNMGQAEMLEKGKAVGADDYIVISNVTPHEVVARVVQVLAKKLSLL